MDAAQLIKRLQAQRESTVEVEPGKHLVVRRPAETALAGLRGGLTVEKLVACVTGWRGITEADLLGSNVGATDEVPFDSALVTEVLADRSAWVDKAAAHLASVVTAYLDAKAATAKN